MLILCDRSGRLRQAQTPQLPTDRRLLSMLFRRKPVLVRERQGKVGPRDNPPLPENSVLVGGHASRPPRRQHDDREVGQEQAKAHICRTGREARQGAEGREVRGMLGAHPEGAEERL